MGERLRTAVLLYNSILQYFLHIYDRPVKEITVIINFNSIVAAGFRGINRTVTASFNNTVTTTSREINILLLPLALRTRLISCLGYNGSNRSGGPHACGLCKPSTLQKHLCKVQCSTIVNFIEFLSAVMLIEGIWFTLLLLGQFRSSTNYSSHLKTIDNSHITTSVLTHCPQMPSLN